LDFEKRDREEKEYATWIDMGGFDGSVKRGGAGCHGRGGYGKRDGYSQHRQDQRLRHFEERHHGAKLRRHRRH